MMTDLTHYLSLVAWVLVWGLGGVWLARAAFRLRANEQVLVGFAVGFIIQNSLVNALARWVALPLAAWLAAALVLAAGLILAFRRDGWAGLRFSIRPLQLVLFAGLVFVYFMISRGMAIFDDYAHLPTVSIMATGDIPPHFSLDPQVIYGYHHFLLLFSAQVMRVAQLPPWTALDVGRALSFGLSVMLAGLFAQRLTRSMLAGLLGGAMMAFGSGSRWLLLLIPHRLLLWIGRGMEMLGSGASSGANLAEALTHPWAAEGTGPMPFPFAFANGIYTPGVITANGVNGIVVFTVILLLLLTFHHWRGVWVPAVVSALIFSSWGLLTEAELVLFLAGWGLVALVFMLRARSLRLPSSLYRWLGVIGAGSILGFASGGAWTDLIAKSFQRLTTGSAPASYQTVGFTLAWPPAIVSSHLGVLSLLDPAQLLVALLEIGPVLLALPLLAWFGWRAFREGRWYESAAAAAAVLSLSMVFVQFTGSTGVRNTPRLYVFIPLAAVFAVPLAWWWAGRKADWVKAAAAALGMVAVLGGMVMFGIELMAAQTPVYSYFLTPLDDQMYAAHWNQLEKNALVFDNNVSRATTLFGRFTNSSLTWYQVKPAWQALEKAPDPARLRAAGFDYLYLDESYWDKIGPAFQQALSSPCVKVVHEVSDQQGHFRRLVNIHDCH